MNTINNRVVVYLQSQENLILLPKCYENLTAINLSSFHLGYTPETKSPYIHLNDNVPEDPKFFMLWEEMRQAQLKGVLLFAMLGGAGGAYASLFGNYNTLYPILVNMLKKYNFNGIDLDVEEQVSQADIQKLISDLRSDFPNNFYITSAPVCLALQTGKDPLSGINWFALKDQIDWFNVQFYSGFGTLANTNDYQIIIDQGYTPNQILGGALTNNDNGSGYVDISTVSKTLSALNIKYNGQLGGTMGWEFYNANDSFEKIDPIGWTFAMKNAQIMQSQTIMMLTQGSNPGFIVTEYLENQINANNGKFSMSFCNLPSDLRPAKLEFRFVNGMPKDNIIMNFNQGCPKPDSNVTEYITNQINTNNGNFVMTFPLDVSSDIQLNTIEFQFSPVFLDINKQTSDLAETMS